MGIAAIGASGRMGILSGLGGDHQCVVAFDLQPAAVEDGVWSFYIFHQICFDSITPSGEPPTPFASVYIEFY